MPQSKANVELKNFSGGLVTDLNPLTGNISTAKELNNFRIETDGSISVRDGLEVVNTITATPVYPPRTFDFTHRMYLWEQVENYDYPILVLIHDEGISLFDVRDGEISVYLGGIAITNLYEHTFSEIDGKLVVTSGGILNTYYLGYNGTTMYKADFRLQVNDFFGVDDGLDVADTYLWAYGTHPTQTRRNYNQLNQGFLPDHLADYSVGSGPANTSIFTTGFDSLDVFDSGRVKKADGKAGREPAPKGKAVIDLFYRTDARLDFVNKVGTPWDTISTRVSGDVDFDVTQMPVDEHSDGSVLGAAHQGRMFYAMRDWELVGGDAKTPTINNMILYSQAVTDVERLGACHTKGDVTSIDGVAQSDADGGYISISGFGDVLKLLSMGTTLMVFTTEGVWGIESPIGIFTGSSYNVRKITAERPASAASIVTFNNSVTYFSDSGVIKIEPDVQSGRYTAGSISEGKISNRYKEKYLGQPVHTSFHDSIDNRLYWFMGDRVTFAGLKNIEALIYDTVSGAFSEITGSASEGKMNVMAGVLRLREPPANSRSGFKLIQVHHGGSLLTINEHTYSKDAQESDVVADMVTNVSTFGDATKRKFNNYLTAYLKQTEQTQDDVGLLNQSSCLMRVSWDFADSVASNKFSREFQAYRLRRLNVSETTDFDYGHSVVVTRNKVRGSGKSLAVRIRSEVGKQCHLHGISLEVAGNSNI